MKNTHPLQRYDISEQAPTNKLRTRMYGHQTHINTLENKLAEGYQYTDPEIQLLQEKSALMNHCINHQHRFNIQQPSLVDSTYKR